MPVPNNVRLDENPALLRKLECYQTKFQHWWRERGPSEFLDREMTLRVPTGAPSGKDWASFRRMRPSEYQWGIYVVPTERQHIAFGDQKGRKAWEQPPDEFRTLLLDHIRVQADVENAAIEQSSELTKNGPSAGDLQNLFQFFVEEGRHTWAMVHLLLEHFGEDGEAEADGLLTRMSGNTENPRLLDAFNCNTDDWLSHFLWCFLADRVGKYQIQAVTQSAFLPLARTTKFMMNEEPLHISFGSFGIERMLHRSIEVTLREDSYDIFAAGAIPLPVIQRYINYWASKIYDLFGNDRSSRSRDLFRFGIRTPRAFDPEAPYLTVDVRVGDQVEQAEAPPELVTNTIMRRQYVAEVQKIMDRWNAVLHRKNVDLALRLPHERFNREFGPCVGLPYDVAGERISGDPEQQIAAHLPSAADIRKVRALMQRRIRKGFCASWISPLGTRLDDL